jgi:hypothetical protein
MVHLLFASALAVSFFSATLGANTNAAIESIIDTLSERGHDVFPTVCESLPFLAMQAAPLTVYS